MHRVQESYLVVFDMNITETETVVLPYAFNKNEALLHMICFLKITY
jgi:hypothetical protein